MGSRPSGFLDRRSTSCQASRPSREDKSLQVFSTEYKSLSLSPVDGEDEKRVETVNDPLPICPACSVPCKFRKTIKTWSGGTGGADGESGQGPAEPPLASEPRAQSGQAAVHQLAQRLRQVLQALLQLQTRRNGAVSTQRGKKATATCARVATKARLNLVKGGKVPQVLAGQVQVERTRCSLLHHQRLELHAAHVSVETSVGLRQLGVNDQVHTRGTWLLNAESLSFFPKESSSFLTISFRSSTVSGPSANRTAPLFSASVCNSGALLVMLNTKQTP